MFKQKVLLKDPWCSLKRAQLQGFHDSALVAPRFKVCGCDLVGYLRSCMCPWAIYWIHGVFYISHPGAKEHDHSKSCGAPSYRRDFLFPTRLQQWGQTGQVHKSRLVQHLPPFLYLKDSYKMLIEIVVDAGLRTSLRLWRKSMCLCLEENKVKREADVWHLAFWHRKLAQPQTLLKTCCFLCAEPLECLSSRRTLLYAPHIPNTFKTGPVTLSAEEDWNIHKYLSHGWIEHNLLKQGNASVLFRAQDWACIMLNWWCSGAAE